MKPAAPSSNSNLRAIKLAVVAGTTLATLVLTQCMSTGSDEASVRNGNESKAKVGSPEAIAAWETVYKVLQHPRCLNCHPAGDSPLQGDESHVHLQNVQRGEDGHGVYAMKCQTCHQETNVPGEHAPPGGPNWHLPPQHMKLVFEGVSSADLCRQLQDFDRNDHHTMDEILHHMEHAPLVLWGWEPGNGRTVPPISHAEVVRAMRTWIDNGCGCP